MYVLRQVSAAVARGGRRAGLGWAWNVLSNQSGFFPLPAATLPFKLGSHILKASNLNFL